MALSPFFQVHSDLPREGPGDLESLNWACDLADLRRDGSVLDAACGPGGDLAGLLARVPDGHVTAIDKHAHFIAAVQDDFPNHPRLTATVGDMLDPPGPFDLIWCAGALYFKGVTEGLEAWSGALGPGGRVAFSEPVWLSPAPSPEATAFWADYPDITDLSGIEARVAQAGFRTIGHRMQVGAPWEAYYRPMAERIAHLRTGEVSLDLKAALAESETEIAQWKACPDEIAYALLVVAPT